MGRTCIFGADRSQSFVIGVKSVGIDAELVLRKRTGTALRYILWTFDRETGAIILNSGDGKLAISPKDDKLELQSPLVLNSYDQKHYKQHWEQDLNPGLIFSVLDPQICFGIDGGTAVDGAPLVLLDRKSAASWKAETLNNLSLAT